MRLVAGVGLAGAVYFFGRPLARPDVGGGKGRTTTRRGGEPGVTVRWREARRGVLRVEGAPWDDRPTGADRGREGPAEAGRGA